MFATTLAIGLIATSWRAPWPKVETSSDGSFAISIAPGKWVNNKQEHTKLHLFGIGETGEPQTLWRSEIEFYPSRTYITQDGRVVMVNQYPGYGEKFGVVIFDDAGKIIGNHTTKHLFSEQEWDGIPGNPELKPKYWAEHVLFQSVKNLVSPPAVSAQPEERKVGSMTIQNSFPLALEIRAVTGKIFWFDLQTGDRIDRSTSPEKPSP